MSEQKPRIITPYELSIGITWVSGKIFMKHNSKFSKCWYGVCHLQERIYMFTPLDYPAGSLVTTIVADLISERCDKATACLNYDCRLNRFDKDAFISEFSGMGGETLGLTRSMGQKPEWFNAEERYIKLWAKAVELFSPQGGHWEWNPNSQDVGD